MTFTGQVIFPIYNELGHEGKFIRPGYVTLAQKLRLPHRWFVQVVAGNFDSGRYGIDSYFNHRFQNGNLNFKLELGYTGSSHFFDNQWVHSKLNSFTWSSSFSYFYPRYNLEFEAGIAKYIYRDNGLFASCTRRFGEIAIGFYAQAGENSKNGGFYLTVPFPFQKRKNRKLIRINLPTHYELSNEIVYEYYYGQNFNTSPQNKRINNYTFNQQITNEILTLKNTR